jgi:hypothetical protein
MSRTATRSETTPTTDLLLDLSRWWWSGALVFYGLGDLLTTALGLQVVPVVEASPVVARAVAASGLWAIVPLKALVFVIAYVLWVAVPRPHNVGVPLGLFAFGLVVTVWNTIVLLTSL